MHIVAASQLCPANVPAQNCPQLSTPAVQSSASEHESASLNRSRSAAASQRKLHGVQHGHTASPNELAPPHGDTHESKLSAAIELTVSGSETSPVIAVPVNAEPEILSTPYDIVTVESKSQFLNAPHSTYCTEPGISISTRLSISSKA